MNNITELLKMCANIDFDKEQALPLIRSVDINDELNSDPKKPTMTNTFLKEACLHTNVKMVRLLLENGADPNFILCEKYPLHQENPFWDMQYSPGDSEEDHKAGLEIAQLMLDYGANPLIEIEKEDLLSYVCYEVFNADSYNRSWEYRVKFFILLIAYGGANEYIVPKIIGEFDKNNMEQYHLNFILCDDGYHLTGEILDAMDNLIATV